MILKVTKKQRFTLSSDSIFFAIYSYGYILGLKREFFNENSILGFQLNLRKIQFSTYLL